MEELWKDPDFRSLHDKDPGAAADWLGQRIPEFSGLERGQQLRFLNDQIHGPPGFGRGVIGGAIGSWANFQQLLANTLELGADIMPYNDGAWYRSPPGQRPDRPDTAGMSFLRDVAEGRQERAREVAHEASDYTSEALSNKVGQVVGGLPLGLATVAAATAPYVPVAGPAAPILGFGSLGYLQSRHLGEETAVKHAAIDASIGALFPGLRHLSRPTRAGAIGGYTAAVSEAESGVDRAIEAVTMGVFGGLHGAKAPLKMYEKMPMAAQRGLGVVRARKYFEAKEAQKLEQIEQKTQEVERLQMEEDQLWSSPEQLMELMDRVSPSGYASHWRGVRLERAEDGTYRVNDGPWVDAPTAAQRASEVVRQRIAEEGPVGEPPSPAGQEISPAQEAQRIVRGRGEEFKPVEIKDRKLRENLAEEEYGALEDFARERGVPMGSPELDGHVSNVLRRGRIENETEAREVLSSLDNTLDKLDSMVRGNLFETKSERAEVLTYRRQVNALRKRVANAVKEFGPEDQPMLRGTMAELRGREKQLERQLSEAYEQNLNPSLIERIERDIGSVREEINANQARLRFIDRSAEQLKFENERYEGRKQGREEVLRLEDEAGEVVREARERPPHEPPKQQTAREGEYENPDGTRGREIPMKGSKILEHVGIDVEASRAKAEFARGSLFRDMLDFREGTDVPKQVVKAGEVLERLTRGLGIPVEGGAIKTLTPRHKKAWGLKSYEDIAGIHHTHTGSVRVRTRNDIQTAAHELGHALAKMYPELRRAFDSAPHLDTYMAIFRGEKTLDDLPKHIKQLHDISYDWKSTNEGFAEWFRHYITDPRYVRENTPDATAILEPILKANLKPKQWKAIERAQKDFNNYFDQSGVGGIRAAIGPDKDPAQVLHSRADAMRQSLIDDFHGLLNYVRKVYGDQIPGDVYEQFRLLRGIGKIQETMLSEGVPTWVMEGGKQKIAFTGKGLFDILAPVARSKKQLDRFFDYAIALQAAELKGQRINPQTGKIERLADMTPAQRKYIREINATREQLLSDRAVRDGLELRRDHPEYDGVVRDLAQFQKQVMDFAEIAGLVNRTQRSNWMRKVYLFGFFREMGAQAKGLSNKGDPLSSALGIKRLRGSSRQLRDPLRNLMDGPMRTIQLALENRAKQSLADTYINPTARQRGPATPGMFMDKISPKSDVVRLQTARIKEAMESEIAKTQGISRAAAREIMEQTTMGEFGSIDAVSMFLGNSKPFGSNIMTVMRNGRPEYYEIKDDLLLRAVSAVRRDAPGPVVGPWNWLRRFKQEWITTDPSFIMANFARDLGMATIMSRTGHFHLFKAIDGMRHAMLKTPEYADWVASGGGGSTLRDSLNMTRKRLIRHARQTGGDPRGIIFTPWDGIRALQHLGRVVEQGPRIGEFLAAKRRGETQQQAGFRSAEISTDFQVRGDHGLMNFFSNTIPFFNAMVAGGDRIYRAHVRDPQWKARTALKTGMVGVMSATLYALNRQNPEYNALPDWDKWAYWHFYAPDRIDPETGRMKYIHYKMPKIWEIGMIGTWAERFMESLLGSEDLQERGLGEDLSRIMFMNFGIDPVGRGFPLPLPVGIDIAAEQWSNRVLFTGSPIETSAMRNLENWRRARADQPRSIKALGETFGFSPARAEALLRGIFSEWAMYGLHTLDAAAYPGGPAWNFDDLPGVRRFRERPGKYDRNTGLFYERLEAANQAYGTVRDLAEAGDVERLDEYMKDPKKMLEISMSRSYDRVNRAVQKLNKHQNLIQRGIIMRDNSPEEKRDTINQIEREKISLQRAINKVYEEERARIRRMEREGA